MFKDRPMYLVHFIFFLDKIRGVGKKMCPPAAKCSGGKQAEQSCRGLATLPDAWN